ncbi:MAG: PsbP-related protein [Leptospirales bacterium]
MNIKLLTYQLIVGLYLFTFLFGCQSTQEKAGYTRYSDDKNHFSIALPSDWQVRQNRNGVAIAGIIPKSENKPAKEGIIILAQKIPTNSRNRELGEYYKSSLKLLKRTLTNFSLVESKSAKIDGVEAYRFIARYKFGNTELQGLFYVFIHDNLGYGISCSAFPENFAKHEKMFAQIVKNFRFESRP